MCSLQRCATGALFLMSIVAQMLTNNHVANAWQLSLTNQSSDNLSWPCVVIQTQAISSTQQSPVVTGVDSQPAGNLVATVGDDHIVGIYDKLQGQFIKHLRKHTDWVRVAKFSNDGKKLVTAGNDGRILVWQVGQWDQPIELGKFTHAIVDVAIHPGGDQVAIVGFNKKLTIIDLNTRRITRQIACPCQDMRTITYSPSGLLLAGGGRNGTIEIWDAATGQSVQKIAVHQQRIRSIRFLDDQNVVSCGEDRKIKLLSVGTDSIDQLPIADAKLLDVAILNEDLIATCGTDNRICIWSLKDKKRIGFLAGHNGSVSCLDVEGDTLVSGSFDTKIRVWKTSQQTNMTVPSQPRFGNSQWQQRTGSGQLQGIK